MTLPQRPSAPDPAPASAHAPRSPDDLATPGPATEAPSGAAPARPARGRLLLVPNALDHGTGLAVSLDEVLPRAVIARAAALRHWVVEDAKSARAFLRRVGAVVPLVAPIRELAIVELPRIGSARPEPTAVADARWSALLAPAAQGSDVGLLSEAGMPAVADPGAALVAAAHVAQIAVEPLVGPSALLLALAASGLDGQRFAFLGYLPVDSVERTAAIRAAEAQSRRLAQTQLVIETPYRHAALFDALLQTLAPTTRLTVALGLTLPDATVATRPVAAWRTGGPPAWPARWPAVLGWLAR